MLKPLAALAAGSLAGGFGRYLIGGFILRLAPGFPFGTLAVNVLGCGMIGMFDVWAQRGLGPEQRLLWMTGFCGGLTTLSSLVLETEQLARAGHAGRAAAYVVVTLVLAFAAFRLGRACVL